jgi:hypothetical protein
MEAREEKVIVKQMKTSKVRLSDTRILKLIGGLRHERGRVQTDVTIGSLIIEIEELN